MIYKNWTITPDGYSADYAAYHDSYDPTPINPGDPMGDPDKVLYGDTPEALMAMIDGLEADNGNHTDYA